jgi:hypothetical protein
MPAEAQKDELEAGGLPADFVEQLRRAAASVLQAIDQRAEDMARKSAAAAAVQGEVVRGRSAMSVLDAMVGPRFEGEFEVSAEWRSLMRQGRLRRVTEGDGSGEAVGGVGTGAVGEAA